MPLDAIKQIELEEALAQIERERGKSSFDLKALIAKGWRATYAELFGQDFVDSLDSIETDDHHHSEAIEWHWNARLGLISYELEFNRLKKELSLGVINREAFDTLRTSLQIKYLPVFWAYLAIWARANLKTTIARRMTVTDAVLSVAFDVGGYALIIGGTKKKVRGTAASIETLLHSQKIKEYAPSLSAVKRNEQGASKGWTADFLNTEANYVFHFIGLDEGVAGANVDDIRPTFIIPDDIDDREDSPVISDSRFNVFTRAVLPTKQWNTLFFFAQNLISRFSTLYRIHKQQVRVLTNRIVTEPIPAVRNPVYEQRTVNGIIKDIIISGQCTWRGWNLRRVQEEIDTYGLPAFEIECQHEVEQSKEGLILYNYDDNVHVISESEFESVYGKNAWKYWAKKPGNDWARTKTDKHANVAGYLTVSSQNTPLPNFTFFIHPMSFPANSAPEDVAERLLSVLSLYAYGATTWHQLRKDITQKANIDFHASTVEERIRFERGELAKIVPRYAEPLLKRCLVQAGEMSHEQDTVRQIYSSIYSLILRGTNPKKHGGTELINRDMRVDYELPHPFRPEQVGYTKWFLVAPDDRTKEPKIINGIKVYPPRPYPEAMSSADLTDSDLARFHFRNCRYAEPKLTELGERIDEPLKMFDDFFNLLQMWYVGTPLMQIALNENEFIEAAMPVALKSYNLIPEGQKGIPYSKQMARIEEEARIRKQLDLPKERFDEYENSSLFENGGW